MVVDALPVCAGLGEIERGENKNFYWPFQNEVESCC